MKHLKMFSITALTAISTAVFAASVSATVITSPASTTYAGTISASAGVTSLHNDAFSVWCNKSLVTGKVEFHGAGTTAGGAVSTLSFSECTRPVTVLAKGSLEVAATSGGNGTVRSSVASVTIHGPFGVNCLYTTAQTDVGTLTGSSTTNATAKLDINSALIPRTGDSPFCGTFGEWTGSYTVNTPDYLDVD